MITISKVAKQLGKQRSALKNHVRIIEMIKEENVKIEATLERASRNKSTSRKSKSAIKAERDAYKEKYHIKIKSELETILNSELLISQADLFTKVSMMKVELAELRDELAQIKIANQKLQKEKHELEKTIFIGRGAVKGAQGDLK